VERPEARSRPQRQITDNHGTEQENARWLLFVNLNRSTYFRLTLFWQC
jgi:hypothetical protein